MLIPRRFLGYKNYNTRNMGMKVLETERLILRH
ncbi:MAG: hypothetical protein A370_02248 [Clostridium sp. Maddingley MBC34-26]|nr:MAG: hypothetical protein A370_02248 [Clostridium sp. Maddingley MBC34-26]